MIRDPYVEAVFRREDAARPWLEKLAVALSMGGFVEELAEARKNGTLFVKSKEGV